ncbi:MAG: HDOD domain-containing protein [Thermodesulfobacteriota bacterium]
MAARALQRLRGEVIRTRDLPAAPSALVAALSLTDADEHADQLIALVAHDPALYAKVLRVANSTLFGQRRAVASAERALLVLGFSTLRNLVLGMSVWEDLGRGVPRPELEALWRHSLLTARLSHDLAMCVAVDRDAAFAAGMLHDAGRLVLARHFGAEYWQALERCADGTPVDRAERDSFDVDHARVAGWLFEAWALPEALTRAAQEHHHEHPPDVLGRVVGTANRLLRAPLPGCGDAAGIDDELDRAASLLGIDRETVLWHLSTVAATEDV